MSQNLFSALLLFDVAVKTLPLLTVTLAGAFLLRDRSAATIHRCWVLGFGGCIAIPIITLIAPSWTLPILPDTLQAVPSSVNNRPAVLASQERLGDFATPTRPPNLLHLQDRPQTPGGAPAIVDAAVTAGSKPTPIIKPTEFSWAKIGLTVWIVGVLVCLVRKSWQHVALLRLLKRCTKIDDEAWGNVADEAARSLGLHSKVSLLMLHEAQSPMTAGLLQATVVLPDDAKSWPSARRRLVLLHELAHVKRRDVLTQTLAGLVSAFYWFNPICWIGLIQMRKLRELACDDLVLSCGQQPADYAEVLLDVARSYQHSNFSTAVGMAHSTNVESRILAILDKARSHVTLTRRTARLLLASATALVLLIGSARLESQAEPPAAAEVAVAVAETTPTQSKAEAPQSIANKEATDTDDLRTMEVRILDEQGNPLEGAKLTVGIWYIKGYQGEKVPKEYASNSEGVVNLKLPRRLHILRMWPHKRGYVPEFVNFSQGSHDEGKQIPDHYKFELARGTKLGGTVVDESGQPISGVKVDVSVEVRESAWGRIPKPMISTWLTDEDFQDGAIVTDIEGKWRINTAPAQSGKKDFEFRLKFTHEDYASDSEWGGLQGQQQITTAKLRSATAKIVLSSGKTVSGTVVDSSGKPVTKGFVVWRDDSYSDAKKFETKLDEAGRFETTRLSPGEYPITVIAAGFQPERRMITVAGKMADLRFALKPGKRLAIKVVDLDGNPVPNAYFHIGSWPSVEPLFNGGQSSVFNSRIPRSANEKGVYLWDGAPEDAVTYNISARGFATKAVTLIATEKEHVVELLSSLVASGKVTDARTGKLIPAFRVLPIHVHRPDWHTTWFLGAVTGVQGRYEIKLDGSSDSRRFKVRVEADGYRTIISERTFDLSDGLVNQDFSLEPAKARVGIVVNNAQEHVALASVVQATPSIVPSMRDAGLNGGSSGRSEETTEDGRFDLAATSEPVRIRVTHESGFAEVMRQPEEAIGTITLQPWAKLTGRLMQDGRPVPEQTVYFSPVPRGKLGDPRFQDSYRTKTDAEGGFEFERLPPIPGNIRAMLGLWQDSPLASSQGYPLDLKPGEHRSVTLGGEGIAVTGKVVATGRGDAKLNRQWSLNHLISRNRGIELADGLASWNFDPAERFQTSWFLDPGYHDWLSTRENYFVKLTSDGQLHISGVPLGTYDLVLQLYEQPAGCLVETIGEKVVTVEVTEVDAAQGTKDLGTIEVECRAGPRVGESMRIYSFTDTSGRQRMIGDMKGRYVLLHVWASWCAPCLESMPDVRATVEALADEPITFVGLNIDKEVDRAEALVRRGGWDWSQNYLGDASDMARQLAISSAPTYFLVGPDGLLIASSNQWKEMKAAVESALNEDRE